MTEHSVAQIPKIGRARAKVLVIRRVIAAYFLIKHHEPCGIGRHAIRNRFEYICGQRLIFQKSVLEIENVASCAFDSLDEPGKDHCRGRECRLELPLLDFWLAARGPLHRAIRQEHEWARRDTCSSGATL